MPPTPTPIDIPYSPNLDGNPVVITEYGQQIEASAGVYLNIVGQEAVEAAQRGDVYVYDEDAFDVVQPTITHGRVRWILNNISTFSYHAKVNGVMTYFFDVVIGFD